MIAADPISLDLPMASPAMPMQRHLDSVERWTLILSAALLVTSLLLGGASGQVGALCGAGLSLLNARLLARLGHWASRGGDGTARLRLGLLLAAFQLKLGVVAALIYLMLRFLPLSPLWLILGVSLLPLAICARAVQLGVLAVKGDREHHG